MIARGILFCDQCKSQILLDKPPIKILVEFEKGTSDRHYCEICCREIPKQEASHDEHPQFLMFPKFRDARS